MPFSVVTWAYQDEATSAKLAQMVENLAVHDHRSDGSQGAALVGEWVTASGLAASAGWSVSTRRYRVLLGGAVVLLDLALARTGGELVFSAETQANPGNMFDTTQMFTGLPADARPASDTFLFAERGGQGSLSVRVAANGTGFLAGGNTGGHVYTGNTVTIRGALFS